MFQDNPSRGSPVQLALALGLVMAVVFMGFNPAQAEAPGNDTWETAEAILSLPYTVTASNAEATGSYDDPYACQWAQPLNTLWYTFTPAASTAVHVNLTSPAFTPVLAVLTRDEWGYNQIQCLQPGGIGFTAQAGITYYIMVGASGQWSPYPSGPGFFTLTIEEILPPANDLFANSEAISALPFTYSGNSMAAGVEEGEPLLPSCLYGQSLSHTVWFAYPAAETRRVTAQVTDSFYSTTVAVYTGSEPGNLVEQACRTYASGNPVTFYAQAGVTYYIQLGSPYPNETGAYNLWFGFTPPPNVSFSYDPYDASTVDTLTFWSYAYDPYGAGISGYEWDFGDGATATGSSAPHAYTADGDYTVWHQVQTSDGRTAETTQVIHIVTHDVGIAKLSVPTSARVGQTRSIVVGLSNTHYAEVVVVELWKSGPNGFEFVGRLQQSVPVRPLNRTTEFSFNYTFTSADAAQGKVVFKVDAYLQNYRDVLPGDNQASAAPTRVTR